MSLCIIKNFIITLTYISIWKYAIKMLVIHITKPCIGRICYVLGFFCIFNELSNIFFIDVSFIFLPNFPAQKYYFELHFFYKYHLDFSH